MPKRIYTKGLRKPIAPPAVDKGLDKVKTSQTRCAICPEFIDFRNSIGVWFDKKQYFFCSVDCKLEAQDFLIMLKKKAIIPAWYKPSKGLKSYARKLSTPPHLVK